MTSPAPVPPVTAAGHSCPAPQRPSLPGPALCIFGSRTLDDPRVEAAIAAHLAAHDYRCIITALDPGGVCARVRDWTRRCRRGYILIATTLNTARAAGMHEHRSRDALTLADHLLAIWDGTSAGTAGEIALAHKLHVPTTIVRLEILSPAGAPAADPDLDAMIAGLATHNPSAR
jgi:hypothetical protein